VISTKLDPLLYAVRDELLAKIKTKERELEQSYSNLKLRLTDKEEDLTKVKMLFVSKLKELESSFAEISAEVEETGNLQAAKKQSNGKDQFQGILNKYNSEELDQELETLVTANQELIERNEALRQEI
jgi:hypothetical protein